MKTTIAVTLIIMGSLLLLTPALSDCLYQRNLVDLASRPGVQSVNLDGKMGDDSRLGYWLAGGAMVGIAVAVSLGGCRRTEAGGLHSDKIIS
jgi:hypothetical protein